MMSACLPRSSQSALITIWCQQPPALLLFWCKMCKNKFHRRKTGVCNKLSPDSAVSLRSGDSSRQQSGQGRADIAGFRVYIKYIFKARRVGFNSIGILLVSSKGSNERDDFLKLQTPGCNANPLCRNIGRKDFLSQLNLPPKY